MSFLTLPHKWTSQPQYQVNVDQGSPQAQGTKAFLYPVSGRLYDAVSQTFPTTSSFGTAPTYGVGTEGGALASNAAGGLIYSNTAAFSMNTYTVTMLFELTSVDNPWGGLFSVYNSDGTARFGLQRNSSTNNFVAYHTNATGATISSSSISGLIGVGPVVITVSYDGTNLRYYRNGVLVQTVAFGVSPSAASSPRLVLFGSRDASGTYASGGKIYAVDVKEGAASDSQVIAIHRNMWEMLQPLQRNIYVASAGGGGNVIDLASVSFGFTANTSQNYLAGSLGAASQAFTAQTTQNTQAITPTAPSLSFTANTIQNRLSAALSAATLTFTAHAITVAQGATTFVIDLTAATFAYTAQSVQLAQSMAMSAASMVMNAGTVALTQAASLTAATLTFLGKSIQNRLAIGLTAAALGFTAWAITFTGTFAAITARLLALLGVGS